MPVPVVTLITMITAGDIMHHLRIFSRGASIIGGKKLWLHPLTIPGAHIDGRVMSSGVMMVVRGGPHIPADGVILDLAATGTIVGNQGGTVTGTLQLRATTTPQNPTSLAPRFVQEVLQNLCHRLRDPLPHPNYAKRRLRPVNPGQDTLLFQMNHHKHCSTP